MPITCPASKNIVVPSIAGGNVIPITLTDLGITTSSSESIFFTNAFITLVDDADGNSIFPNIPNGTVDRSGAITNNANTIFYTTAATVNPGDVITIEYLAKDDNDNCEQTFTVTIGGGAAALPGCVEGLVVNLTGVEKYTVAVDNSATAPVTFSDAVLSDSDGTNVNQYMVLAANEPSISFNSQTTPSGIYTFSYRLLDGAGDFSQQKCEVTLNYANVDGVTATCLPIDDVILSNGTNASITITNPGTLPISNMRVIDSATGQNITVFPIRNRGASIDIGNVPDNTSVKVTYEIRGGTPDRVLQVCNGFRIIKTANLQGTVNGVNCANTRFTSGNPVIRCGGDPSTHEVYLEALDGSPLSLAADQVSIGQTANTPDGVVFRVLTSLGNGLYTIEIDPSGADCAGSTSAGLFF